MNEPPPPSSPQRPHTTPQNEGRRARVKLKEPTRLNIIGLLISAAFGIVAGFAPFAAMFMLLPHMRTPLNPTTWFCLAVSSAVIGALAWTAATRRSPRS